MSLNPISEKIEEVSSISNAVRQDLGEKCALISEFSETEVQRANENDSSFIFLRR